MEYDIKTAARVSGLTRGQIDQAQSRWCMVLSSCPRPAIGQARKYTAADIFRMRALYQLVALNTPWEAIVLIDAGVQLDKYFNPTTTRALIAWQPSPSTQPEDFQARIVPLEEVGRWIKNEGADAAIVLNLAELASEVSGMLAALDQPTKQSKE